MWATNTNSDLASKCIGYFKKPGDLSVCMQLIKTFPRSAYDGNPTSDLEEAKFIQQKIMQIMRDFSALRTEDPYEELFAALCNSPCGNVNPHQSETITDDQCPGIGFKVISIIHQD